MVKISALDQTGQAVAAAGACVASQPETGAKRLANH
jgi:hypothetical protein